MLASLLAGFAVWYALREGSAPTPNVSRQEEPAPRLTPERLAAMSSPPVEDPARAGTASVAVKTNAALDPWAARWARQNAEAPSPERDASLCHLLEDLAARDPDRARAFALEETREPLRTDLLRAVLAGWATDDIEAAGRWALTQDHLYQDAALAAVFHGARSQPDEAVRYARYLAQADPSRTGDVGHYLIHALGEADEHQRAATYAAAGGAFAKEWLVPAYAQWARQDPPVAIAAAAQLRDEEQRRTASRAAIAGWAKVDPAALLRYAESLHPGSDRDRAIVAGLRALAAREPDAAAAWIAKSAPISGVETVLED